MFGFPGAKILLNAGFRPLCIQNKVNSRLLGAVRGESGNSIPQGSHSTVESNKWDADDYGENFAFVHELAGPVLELLGPQSGENILDLGCGEGSISKMLMGLGCNVIGVDASQSMVDASVAKGIKAYRMDGQKITFTEMFDAVFSNAALHWMAKDPASVLQGVHRALKPGGRFVAEFGGKGNVAAIFAALTTVLERRDINITSISPWYFPSCEEYGGLLEQNGFDVDEIKLVPRPTPLSTDMSSWLEAFGSMFFDPIPANSRDQVKNEVVDLLRPTLQHEDGSWSVDYVRLRVKATLPPK